ncbi:MAG TPA: hypothetical protein VGA01_09225, partial [Candidatus Binatia bacterium]
WTGAQQAAKRIQYPCHLDRSTTSRKADCCAKWRDLVFRECPTVSLEITDTHQNRSRTIVMF